VSFARYNRKEGNEEEKKEISYYNINKNEVIDSWKIFHFSV